ncbi:hypothetical protein FG167_02295 [Lacinutrix sp. WUR7]|uniref:hypothetical protein n=1 Tax=Lacinutrix sp. WUR7 TaxID=2653681 RepID=UPI00193D96B1|nr:hypothetical protein [Lacinutrix sp. WUR7]QRM88099.1 hypothetical protein FG167_02295 [Lacinutrix sp. WUR7]
MRDRPGKCILLYHGIDYVGQTDINGRFISAQLFEKQLDFLQTHYNLVSLSDLLSNKTDQNRMNIAIVFDDGYRNNLQLALFLGHRWQLHLA